MRLRTSKKIYIHIDCDSFFAECEILKKPELKNKYVIVGNEIVLACNYKTKALGIKTGMHFGEVKKILKNSGTYCTPDHNFYSLVSDKMMKYLSENTLKTEPFSIDEAFCEITGLPELYNMSLEEYVQELQEKVMQHLGIGVSIGVSTTKIKAKIFSKLNKPKGVYIDLGNSKELYEELSLGIVPFIGKSMQQSLQYKCEKVYDFVELGYWYLRKNLGKSATDLWLELVGVEAFNLRKNQHSQSMSRGRSFNEQITSDPVFLYKQLLENFNYLYEELTLRKYKTKRVSIFLRNKEKHTEVFNVILPYSTQVRKDLLQEIKKLFSRYYNAKYLYRSTGVIFGNLEKIETQQLSLFEKARQEEKHTTALLSALNQINAKYNSHVVSFGTDLVGKGFDSKGGIMK